MIIRTRLFPVLFMAIVIFGCKQTEQELLMSIDEYINNNRCSYAIELIDKNIKKYPQNPEFYYYRGWCLLDISIKKAQANFLKCIEIDPSYPNGYKGLATVYTIQGKYAMAEKHFNKAIQLAHDDKRRASIINNMATMYVDYKHDYTKGIILHQKSISLNDIGDYYLGLGSAYYLNGQKKMAEQAWLKAVNDKEFVEVGFKHTIYSKLSAYYFKNGEYKKADIYINKAIKYSPGNEEYIKIKKIIQDKL